MSYSTRIGIIVPCYNERTVGKSLFTEQYYSGMVSNVLPFYFLGGIQILCIGIIGEYLGKIYKEVKPRPRYIIDERLQ